MANVTKTPEKKRIRRILVASCNTTLEQGGWKVAPVRGHGKGRLRRISKDGKSLMAAIRTSQDRCIAFPRNSDDTRWETLSDVDVVVFASVDDPANPMFAQVHMFDAKELRSRFDRTYAARREAGHVMPVGRGVWLSVYREESTEPVGRVGAGIGNAYPPIARFPLDAAPTPFTGSSLAASETQAAGMTGEDLQPLTIAQAKSRLARTLGVDPGSIKITVEA